jgi:hypothetical protein
MASELKVDTISEKTAAGGVTIDGTQLKDTKVFTDQVDPKSGTDLTLGTSGDSVLIPSGVTIANSGTATGFGGGKIGQVLQVVKTDTFSSTAANTWTDVTGLTLDITPTATSSKVLAMWQVNGGTGSVNYRFQFRMLRDSTAIGVGDAASNRERTAFNVQTAYSNNVNTTQVNTALYLDSPSSTSALTYKVQMKIEGDTMYVNRVGEDTDVAQVGRGASSITLMEVLA